jgi:hypothetical protein
VDEHRDAHLGHDDRQTLDGRVRDELQGPYEPRDRQVDKDQLPEGVGGLAPDGHHGCQQPDDSDARKDRDRRRIVGGRQRIRVQGKHDHRADRHDPDGGNAQQSGPRRLHACMVAPRSTTTTVQTRERRRACTWIRRAAMPW